MFVCVYVECVRVCVCVCVCGVCVCVTVYGCVSVYGCLCLCVQESNASRWKDCGGQEEGMGGGGGGSGMQCGGVMYLSESTRGAGYAVNTGCPGAPIFEGLFRAHIRNFVCICVVVSFRIEVVMVDMFTEVSFRFEVVMADMCIDVSFGIEVVMADYVHKWLWQICAFPYQSLLLLKYTHYYYQYYYCCCCCYYDYYVTFFVCLHDLVALCLCA